ncbi:MAG: mannonate dehydratase [Anaerolineae bacterium]
MAGDTDASGQTAGYPLATIPGYYASRPGIQIGTQMAANAGEDDMQLARQLGVEWVMTGLDRPEDHTLDNYVALKQRFADGGLKVFRLHNHSCHNMEAVTLNLPGREDKIEEYLAYIRLLGAAGIHYATYAHMANGIWSTAAEPVRGGALARSFHFDRATTGFWPGRTWSAPLSHGRRYSEDELWENYTYFIRRVVPVAEEAGVYIGIHPDDPPVYDLGGVPRCVFGTFEGYRRAIEMADSANVGVCLCVGCWLEGGPLMGKDVVETIRYFGSRRRLFKVHFRNVTEPMPAGFVETLLDDGYGDMHGVMRALQEVGFDGAVISDHLPSLVGGRRTAEAYAIGYMTALRQAVEAEGRRE